MAEPEPDPIVLPHYPIVPHSSRQNNWAQFLPKVMSQGTDGFCVFASVIQYLKFIVCKQLGLSPANLDGWPTHVELMNLMLEDGSYDLEYDHDKVACATTPLTVFRYIQRHGLVTPQGRLRIPRIDTCTTSRNLGGIDGGIPGGPGEELAEVVNEMPFWDQMTVSIDDLGGVVGELVAVEMQFQEHRSQVVFKSKKKPNKKRRAKMFGHAVLVTGHSRGVEGRGPRHLEVHNTAGLDWGGWGDGKIKTEYEELK